MDEDGVTGTSLASRLGLIRAPARARVFCPTSPSSPLPAPRIPSRQDDPERRPPSRPALARHLPAVGGDDLLDDRQPEPGPGLVALARDAEEPVEHVRQVL